MYATWEEGDLVEIGWEEYDMYDSRNVIAQLSREEAKELLSKLAEILCFDLSEKEIPPFVEFLD